MALALRLLFMLLVVGVLALLLYVYRRRTNQIVAIVLASYAIGVGSRLMSVETEGEVLRNGILAVGGLAVVWAGVWLGARYLQKRGWRPDDWI